MNSTIVQLSCRRWLVAVAVTGISGALQLSNAAESPPANTNALSIALDALVADVLEHNPELNFYRAEIDAAKGERRTAATRANPELATTVGQKQVRGGGLSDEGVAWSVSVQRDPAGLTPQLETRIIEATELTLQRKATDAALASQTAMLELNQLRGASWTQTLTLQPVKLDFTAPPEPEALLGSAQTNNF